MKKLSLLFFLAFGAGAQDAFDTPPPGDIYLAAKLDPKEYLWTVGAEIGWSFASPFVDDFSFGFGAYYLPLPQLRLGVVSLHHFSRNTGLANEINREIGLRDRELQFAEPVWDLLAHTELRAVHGLVKLFYASTIDYETGLFLRLGGRKSRLSENPWNAVFIPGVSQTLIFGKSWNFRLLLSAEIQATSGSLVSQGAAVQGGTEWRF